MSEPLFEQSHSYDEMLNRGLKLSGEDKFYFIEGRLAELKRTLPSGFSPRQVLDFGCGTGETTKRLAELFPGARALGADPSNDALKLAEERHGSERVSFTSVSALGCADSSDLCYVNGVFHHIEPKRRAEAAALVYRELAPGGFFALFENNPWNPGARWVMSRIPFDRDAKPFSPPQARAMLERAGFKIAAERSLFYFPRLLSPLRALESKLAGLPLGAQYLTLAVKP
jgi:SAM-dependent methyltransferase